MAALKALREDDQDVTSTRVVTEARTALGPLALACVQRLLQFGLQHLLDHRFEQRLRKILVLGQDHFPVLPLRAIRLWGHRSFLSFRCYTDFERLTMTLFFAGFFCRNFET